MAEQTLESMYRGGLFDHGRPGGFARYSTDEMWLVPLKKMLGDNALLALAFWRPISRPGARSMGEDRPPHAGLRPQELRGSRGFRRFYRGQDANLDSEGEEEYVFTEGELRPAGTGDERVLRLVRRHRDELCGKISSTHRQTGPAGARHQFCGEGAHAQAANGPASTGTTRCLPWNGSMIAGPWPWRTGRSG